MKKRFGTFLFLALLISGCTVSHVQQKWVEFAWNTPRHMEDLTLLQKELRAEQIPCSEGDIDLGMTSILVDSRDFMRARAVATNIISRDSLTVRVSTDTNSNGYEDFENGKKVSEVYF
jgi:hypothetical protein